MNPRPALLIPLLLATLLPPAAAQEVQVTEGFEAFTFPEDPSSPYYTYSEPVGNVVITDTITHTGNRALRLIHSNTARAVFALPQSACTGIDFWIRAESLGSGSASSNFGLSNGPLFGEGPTDEYLRMNFGLGSAIQITSRVAGVTSSQGIGQVVPLQAQTWRHFGLGCSANKAQIYDYDNGQVVEQVGNQNFGQLRYFIVLAATNLGGDVRLDDINFGKLTHAPAVVQAAASITLTDVVGFDVDSSGNTVIVRTDGGPTVRTLPGGSLTGPSLPATNTGCNRIDGVAALSNFVTFHQCDGPDGAQVVTKWSIRGANLGTPNLPTHCQNGDYCPTNFDAVPQLVSGALDGDQNTQYGLAQIQAFPFDYSQFTEDLNDRMFVAWAFTDNTGRAGVLTYTAINNAPDVSHDYAATIDAGGSLPNNLCTVRDADGKQYLYASSSNSNAKGYRVDMAITDPDKIGKVLEVDALAQVFPGTASTASPVGLGCGDGHLLVATKNAVHLFKRGELAPYKTITGLSDVPPRGATMSANGRWAAYITGTTWVVLNATDGAAVATGTVPAGDLVGMRQDGAGSNLWIATRSGVTRFSTYLHTTGVDYGYNGEEQPGPDIREEREITFNDLIPDWMKNVFGVLLILLGGGIGWHLGREKVAIAGCLVGGAIGMMVFVIPIEVKVLIALPSILGIAYLLTKRGD